ncbi:formylglycine-generating enzyme family protein [Thiohalocapsa sp. ML1]|uniref:formylglycine-generating enzyme family protein n=1 Tax=Thiohalocapsa sp. ML1 TaxID=1431688 RepID=UPI000B1E53FF|nr:formylglycine-generating enzyme family protein [Thiohalocapsa sp. ML1]
MTQSAHARPGMLGRAALAQVIARLDRAEWPAAAAALGFEPVAQRPRPNPPPADKTDAAPAPRARTAPESDAADTAPKPAPYRPADLPDLPFWRIAAVERRPPDPSARRVPGWLADATPWDALPQADRGQPPPRPAALAPAPRQARFLRQVLARPRAGRALDLERLCDCLARCRLPERLPRRRRPRWPGLVHLVLDLSPALRPFQHDLWAWAERLEAALGRRLLRLATHGGSPLDLERLGADAGPRRPLAIADGTPLIILGDAGLYDPHGSRHRHWLALAERSARAGMRPLLLAPVPPRLLTPAVSRRFACALLERGAPLRLARPRRPSPDPEPERPRAPPPLRTLDPSSPITPDAAADAEPPATDPATAALLAALAPGARTEPALLRRLRLLLAGQGSDLGPDLDSDLAPYPDIGSEHAAWNHPDLVADELACALRPDRRAAAEAAFRALPAATRRAILTARAEFHRHSSPFVRLEEALAAAALAGAGADAGLPQPVAAALAQALRDAEHWAATLHRPDRGGQHPPLTAAIAGLGRRRPALLARHRELATAWALAKQTELRAGALAALPPGLDPDLLRWLLAPDDPERPVLLAQQGEAIGLYAADGPAPAAVLAHGSLAGAYWELEPARAPGADAAAGRDDLAQRLRASALGSGLRLGESRPPAQDRRWRITAGDTRWILEAIRRPPWARGLGRDGLGLFAEPAPELLGPADKAATDHQGPRCRLYWQPAGPLAVAGLDDPLPLPEGAWWDAALFEQAGTRGSRLAPESATAVGLIRTALLPAPDWAERHGLDAHGLWAEFSVAGVVQRLRWLPPGEFLMGSPEDEPDRDKDEQQHPVLLTRGLWLADTACTQALWQAVLGETPSGFQGPERPVEQVSWEAVVERFLPALNACVPGLEARLPTEAEWEYACRAGTTTPFSFGDRLSTDQANYDGNYPYAGGEQGEYRAHALDVKALPANQWGLYQMHGNVYEWCQDWLGDYPESLVKDPIGSSAGRGRVLRGGYWNGRARWCRSAFRDARGPASRSSDAGFRLARGPSPLAGEQAGGQGSGAGAAGTGAGGGAPATEPAVPAPLPRGERPERPSPDKPTDSGGFLRRLLGRRRK